MRTIYPPGQEQRSALDCAEALEPAFAQLVERAEFAGWTTNEVLRGLCVLTWRFTAEPARCGTTDDGYDAASLAAAG